MHKCRIGCWAGLQIFGCLSLLGYLTITYNASAKRRWDGVEFSVFYAFSYNSSSHLKDGQPPLSETRPPGVLELPSGHVGVPRSLAQNNTINARTQLARVNITVGKTPKARNSSMLIAHRGNRPNDISNRTTTTTATAATTPTTTEDVLFRIVSDPPEGDFMDYPDLSSYEVPRLSYPKLPRALNATEYQKVRNLMKELDKIFTENNITYILSQGSLLGSYLVHDILPWDDDLDIFVKVSDKKKMLDLFNKSHRYPKIGAIENSGHASKMIKLFFKDSQHAGKYAWRWPFADAVFYAEDSKYVWSIEKGGIQIKQKRSSFYPLHRRPYAGLWLPSPRDPRSFLRQKYRTFVCKSHWWNHRRELSRKPESTSCQSLNNYYPMVHRERDGMGVRETLKLGSKVLYSVHVDEAYGKQKTPYDLSSTSR